MDIEIYLAPGQCGKDEDAHWVSLFDALKHAKLIRNDTSRWVQIGEVSVKRSPEFAGTVVVLTDIAD